MTLNLQYAWRYLHSTIELISYIFQDANFDLYSEHSIHLSDTDSVSFELINLSLPFCNTKRTSYYYRIRYVCIDIHIRDNLNISESCRRIS